MSASEYDVLAPVYDTFQNQSETEHWYELALEQIRRYARISGDGDAGRLLVCDLGCGTGEMCLRLAQEGYDVIGVDLSEDMLNIAREKCDRAGYDVLFLRQDISKLDMFGTVDVFVCMTDTINHITDRKSMLNMVRSFNNFLNPGGIFVFDALSLEHLRDTLGNNQFIVEENGYFIVWENTYRSRNKTSVSEFTIFRHEADNLYQRTECRITEKHYTDKAFESLLKESNMKIISKFEDSKTETSHTRSLYVAQK